MNTSIYSSTESKLYKKCIKQHTYVPIDDYFSLFNYIGYINMFAICEMIGEMNTNG